MAMHLKMRIAAGCLAVIGILAAASLCCASLVGTDNASAAAYAGTDGNGANDGDPTNNTNGWVNGDDGFITGAAAFGAWSLQTSTVNDGVSGFFIGDSRNLSGGVRR